MTRRYVLIASLATAFAASWPLVASSAPSNKRSKSDRDINAIGHRNIKHGQDAKYVGSLEKEKRQGAEWAAEVERSAKLISDPVLTGYLAALAQNLAGNSDMQMPIKVMLHDSDEVNACTSPGGYQYITRGLLLHLESEGELAALLTHGIAHTVLHTPTIQAIRQMLLSVTPMQNSAFAWFTCTSPFPQVPYGMRETDEFDADYFGVQYLYKAGYDPDSYVRFVQRIWPSHPSSRNSALVFSRFPPSRERVRALNREIADILPQRGESTVSTSAFEEFEEHLHTWQTEHPEPKQPILRRAGTNE